MKNDGQKINSETLRQEFLDELSILDKELVDAGGILLKPSQCYRVEQGQILFNTNCPDVLRNKVESIMRRFSVDN